MVIWRSGPQPCHPNHDEVAETIADWYRGPSAEYTVELRELGWCRRSESAPADVTIRNLAADRLAPAIAERAGRLNDSRGQSGT